jgi:tetratricopeptide (TPR) repeat protein
MLFPAFNYSQEPTKKAKKLIREANMIFEKEPAKAKAMANEALDIALELKNDTLEYKARFIRAASNFLLSNLNESLEDFIKLRALAEKLKDLNKRIESLNGLATVYKHFEHYQPALEALKEADELCKGTNNISKIALVESSIAGLYSQMQKYDLSNAYCYKLLRLSDAYPGSEDLAAAAYQPLLSNFIAMGLKDSIVKYTEHILEATKNLGDSIGFAGNMYNLANYYYKHNELSEAEKFLRRGQLSRATQH